MFTQATMSGEVFPNTAMTEEAHGEVASAGEFFSVVQPLELAIFLKASRQVLDTSLMLFAPLGLPKHMRHACPTEAAFVEAYGPRHRAILEAVSEATYHKLGVSESQVGAIAETRR
jgi:hypothetical protein